MGLEGLQHPRGLSLSQRLYRGLGDDIESDEFYAAEQRVDLEAGYTFRNGLKAFAAVTNLTDEPQVSYQGYRQFVEDASLSGRKFNIGLEFSF